MADTDINVLGRSITVATCQLWTKVLDKFGKRIADQFLKDATQEEKQSFIDRLKKAQQDKLQDRLTLIFNRVLTDCYFIEEFDKMLKPHKTLDELKTDLESTNNHLQSVENESSTLQRDIDTTIDKLESLSEEILENKLI